MGYFTHMEWSLLPHSKTSRNLLAAFALATLGPGLTLGLSDDVRHIFNQYSSTPVNQREIITYKASQRDFGAIIAAPYILRTGQVPEYADLSIRKYNYGNFEVEWGKYDAFTRAFARIEDKATELIKKDEVLQQLVGKPEWTKEDRLQWDRHVYGAAMQAFAEVPALNKYRSAVVDTPDIDAPVRYENGKLITTPQVLEKSRYKTPLSLNDLSGDIEEKTYKSYKMELDCKEMTILRTCLLQKIADKLLSPEQRPVYYCVFGDAVFGSENEDSPVAHAFGVSQKDGVILSVIDPANGDNSFASLPFAPSWEKFCQGAPLVSSSNTHEVYGLRVTAEDAANARQDWIVARTMADAELRSPPGLTPPILSIPGMPLP